jgi:hypothetical protein
VNWLENAKADLQGLHADNGWSYRAGASPATEPTVLASLGLLAVAPEDLRMVRSSAQWIASIQQPDGGVGASEELPEPAWPTSWALLLWSVVGNANNSERAADWLLRQQGVCFRKSTNSPLGHDTTIPGWSWVDGTHSWLEPTALAVIALRRAGFGDHERVSRGLDLIRDRAIPEGGWNFGNNIVFGASLRPKPASTALALLALAGAEARTSMVEKSLAYLQGSLHRVRSAQSLGLGLLALSAWSVSCPNARQWLEESHSLVVARSDRACQLAYLLLASTHRTLDLLGARPAIKETANG